MDLSLKQRKLENDLRSLGRTLIAYSGGIDSAYLAWVAHQVLRQDMLAVIADSPSLARTQLQDALAFAQEQEIPMEVIQTEEMARMWVRSVGIGPLSRFQLFGSRVPSEPSPCDEVCPTSLENVYAASSVKPRENRLLAAICKEWYRE